MRHEMPTFKENPTSFVVSSSSVSDVQRCRRGYNTTCITFSTSIAFGWGVRYFTCFATMSHKHPKTMSHSPGSDHKTEVPGNQTIKLLHANSSARCCAGSKCNSATAFPTLIGNIPTRLHTLHDNLSVIFFVVLACMQ